jgi:hypothetical protein
VPEGVEARPGRTDFLGDRRERTATEVARLERVLGLAVALAFRLPM